MAIAQTEHQADAEVAERLIAFLDAGDTSPKSGFRKSERNNYFRRVHLILIGQAQHPRVAGYTRNLSTGGLGLLTRRAFNIGERFVVLLTLGAGIGKYALCRTTSCRYLSDGMCEVGAAFEATAPCLNSNHRIPLEWVAAALNRVPAKAAAADPAGEPAGALKNNAPGEATEEQVGH